MGNTFMDCLNNVCEQVATATLASQNAQLAEQQIIATLGATYYPDGWNDTHNFYGQYTKHNGQMWVSTTTGDNVDSEPSYDNSDWVTITGGNPNFTFKAKNGVSDTDVATIAQLNNLVYITDTIDSFRSISNKPLFVLVRGYYDVSDEAFGGAYYRYAGATGGNSADNGGTVIITNSLQKYELVYTPPLKLSYFGVGLGRDDLSKMQYILDNFKDIDGGGVVVKIQVADESEVLRIKSGVALKNIKFDLTGSSVSSPIIKNYNQSISKSLASSFLEGDIKIPIDATGVEVGDSLFVESDVAFYNDVNFNTMFTVVRVENSEVWVDDSPLLDYPDGASVEVYKTKKITLDAIEFLNVPLDREYPVLEIEGASDIKISSITGRRGSHSYVNFTKATNLKISNCLFTNIDTAGLAYGIVIACCKNVKAYNNEGHFLRHLITVGGFDGVSQNIDIYNNHTSNTYDAGLDSHPTCYNMRFFDNTVLGVTDFSGNKDGIVFQGVHCEIYDNHIETNLGVGVMYQPLTNIRGSATISRNKVKSNKQGILALCLDIGMGAKRITIENNDCVVLSPSYNGVLVSAKNKNKVFYVENILVGGNNIIGVIDAHAIHVYAQDSTTPNRDILVWGNKVTTTKDTNDGIVGVYIQYAKNSLISGNLILGRNAPKIGVRTLGSTDTQKIGDNQILDFTRETLQG